MSILDVDIDVLKQSKQLLLGLTAMIAQKLTECNTRDNKMISETLSFNKSPSAHRYDPKIQGLCHMASAIRHNKSIAFGHTTLSQ